ncbi:hypothetical protein EV424DRAFT_1347044 [Suillus variegatus]|nr:hypothetical protein EV424DRAFT_1347044 [Suillus variegatus]
MQKQLNKVTYTIDELLYFFLSRRPRRTTSPLIDNQLRTRFMFWIKDISVECQEVLPNITHDQLLPPSKALQDLPKSPVVDEELQIYISFSQEIQADMNIVMTKWWSAHLDFHIALALHNNTFMPEQQAVALKMIKCLWTYFREKKPYKKVQNTTGAGLHAHFCLNDNNMYGGPFEHTCSPAELTAEMIQVLQSPPGAEKEIQLNEAKASKSDKKAPKPPGVNSENVRKAVLWKLKATASRSQLSFKTRKIQRRQPKLRKLKSEVADKDTIIDSLANVESKSHGTITAKHTKRKAGGKEAEETGTIGKEEHRLTMENISVDSVVLKQELPYDLEMSQNSKEELDKIILPPGVEDWEAWNKVVLEQGDLQILLKLGAWMLVRFYQLAKILMDREVQGLIILESSPPAVNLSIISDMGIPWLLLMDMMVMHALQNMVIGEIEDELDGQCDQIGQIEGKRKRILLHPSPPMIALSTTTIPIETTNTFESTPKISNIATDNNPDATGEDDAGASLVDSKHIEIAVEADHGDFLVDGKHIVVTGKGNQADQPTNAAAPAEHSNIATLRPAAESSSTVMENANDWLTNMIYSSG